ncbi:hypothetical protein N7U66_09550 [Lacinutrix neustonica]|uniref:Uncharacterized protein n=1 Tax=Lacinutrix neustonica TaxID=2980107 RepID=A0A9E8SIG9_9FLAO|nr:hypothetical protein [Lacinutrix neustonica]WAC03665.1 hypothetical protein N7U66_09550 [Lacinutrix neustonica]
MKDWKGLETYLVAGLKEVSLFIDGERVVSERITSALSIKMDFIEEIAYQPFRNYRIYQVFTTGNYKKGIEEEFIDFIFQEGYSRTKKYYSPINEFNTSKNHTEIDWKPNLQTNAVGEVVFKVKKNEKMKQLQFSIQGFTNNGLLISDLIIKEIFSSY